MCVCVRRKESFSYTKAKPFVSVVLTNFGCLSVHGCTSEIASPENYYELSHFHPSVTSRGKKSEII